MSNLLYSQSGLPKVILYNGDSVELLSLHQVRELNIAHEVWIGCTVANDSLIAVIDSCNQGFMAADSAIAALQTEIASYKLIQYSQAAVIDTLQAVIHDQQHIIHRLKFRAALSHIGEGLLGAIIIWLALR